MPTAPPTSRVTSFIADPTPAFDAGRDPTIAAVAGDMAGALPG
jgi:hypothetical protein